MSSKKDFKKQLNYMVIDIIDECFSVQLYNPSKTEQTDALIDEVINFRNDMSSKIHAAKSKKDFGALRQEVETAAVDFVHKVNGIQ